MDTRAVNLLISIFIIGIIIIGFNLWLQLNTITKQQSTIKQTIGTFDIDLAIADFLAHGSIDAQQKTTGKTVSGTPQDILDIYLSYPDNLQANTDFYLLQAFKDAFEKWMSERGFSGKPSIMPSACSYPFGEDSMALEDRYLQCRFSAQKDEVIFSGYHRNVFIPTKKGVFEVRFETFEQ